MKYLTECPERKLLNDDIHARPYLELNPPEQISYLALLVDREERVRELEHLQLLCRHFDLPAPANLDSKDIFIDFGQFRMKMEVHAEYTHYKFIEQSNVTAPFAQPPILAVPADWLEGLPGKLLVGIHVAILDATSPNLNLSPENLPRYFAGNRLIGGKIAAGNGFAYSDFLIHEDGFSRLLIVNHHFAPGQAGRCLQRLLEIETYRMLALLGLPRARAILPELPDADRQLVELTASLDEDDGQSDEALLNELTQLAATIENKVSATYARFNATRNYASLVSIRLEQLRESKIEGIPSFTEFLERRLNPAVNTCNSVDHWLHQLAQRISNVNQLLLTRIDVRRKQQNQDMLESLNRRAKIQLRLQQAIEGLSVVAITYTAVSILGLVLGGVKSIGIKINSDLTIALVIPILGYFAYLGVVHLHETIEQEDRDGNK
jgi:uncharacterized membrane-anchored protein